MCAGRKLKRYNYPRRHQAEDELLCTAANGNSGRDKFSGADDSCQFAGSRTATKTCTGCNDLLTSSAPFSLRERLVASVRLVCVSRESRPQESEQDDKWIFCLTAGTLCPANQDRQ
jgi:hypothetical protein